VNHPSEILNIGDTVKVKVLDIDRDRQRISLGLKQTQEDPWQRIVDTYNVGDELEGKVTKVVTFGAFVEILDGVEGLVHISELAPHHVESPREIVHPGDEIRVKILEIDSERRRLSLSAKRVEDQILPVARPDAPATEAASAEEIVQDDGADTSSAADGEIVSEVAVEEGVVEAAEEQDAVIEEEATTEPAAEVAVEEAPTDAAAEDPAAAEEAPVEAAAGEAPVAEQAPAAEETPAAEAKAADEAAAESEASAPDDGAEAELQPAGEPAQD
jgi:small subunit ribosomal protein S1